MKNHIPHPSIARLSGLSASAAALTLALAACAQPPTAPAMAPAVSATPAAIPAAAAANKSVPGDAAIPIVELMPLTMRHEAALKLSPGQSHALAEYRDSAMPKRIGLQKQILALRGELRAAMLGGQPTAELMRQVSQAELSHMQARERCVVFMRQTLSPAQYAQLTQLYLDGLR